MPETDPAPEPVNPYEQLKSEMQAQYNELKSAFENSTKEKDELIAQLQKSNQDLQRALLRSAFTEGPSQSEPVKTPEQASSSPGVATISEVQSSVTAMFLCVNASTLSRERAMTDISWLSLRVWRILSRVSPSVSIT